MISNPLAVLSVLSVIVSTMIWLERYRGFKRVGAAAASILSAMLLSNAGILPGESKTYDFLTGYGVLAGTALVLLAVDLRSLKSAGSTMIKAFFLGAAGSVLGATAMGFLLFSAIGGETYKLSGQFAASYVGGGVNFAAVGQAFGTSGELFTAGIAADVIITACWLLVCLAAPGLLSSTQRSAPVDGQVSLARRKEIPRRVGDGARGLSDAESESNMPEQTGTLDKALFSSGKPVTLVGLAGIVALTITILWIATLLNTLLPVIPSVVWLTTLVLILAQLRAIKELSGATVMGNYLILLFLASNGAKSVVSKIVEVGPEVFYFAAGTVAIHGLVIFGLGRLLKFDIGVLAVASVSNVGGPANAVAVAVARDYKDKILPGVAVALMGMALGNYIGLGLGNLMRVLL
jgi:uncharacterized membrane protein